MPSIASISALTSEHIAEHQRIEAARGRWA